jgi:hypothetical protein
MKKLIASAAFFLSLFATQAQEYIDVLNVIYWQAPATDLKDGQGTMQIDNFTVNAIAPVKRDSSYVMLVGAEYSQVSLTRKFDTTTDKQTLYGINLQLAYKRIWSEKFQTFFMVIPRLNSDLESVTSDHFQIGGLVVNTIRKNENFAWKLGAYYNTEFFGPFVVPILGLDWKMNEKWRLKMLLPLNARLRYQPKKNWAVGVAFDGVNGSYRLSDATDSYVEKLENYAGLFADFYLTEKLVLNIKARQSFLRYYRPYAGNQHVGMKMGPVSFGDERFIPTTDFEDGFAIEARLIIRFPVD